MVNKLPPVTVRGVVGVLIKLKRIHPFLEKELDFCIQCVEKYGKDI